MPRSPDLYLGTSGWHYRHWKERFYPSGLATGRWLQFYTSQFPTVEVNNSFYKLPSAETWQLWRETAPDGFVFSVKASRSITHFRKLRETGRPLERFIAGARLLGSRLGPLLFQLPPDFDCDPRRLEEFLASLPKDLNHVMEFRNPSWFVEPVFETLRRYRVTLCVSDMPGTASPVISTSDIGYFRFHGSGHAGGNYSEEDLLHWAEEIVKLKEGLSRVFVYFNNDVEAFAIRNARRIGQILQEMPAAFCWPRLRLSNRDAT